MQTISAAAPIKIALSIWPPPFALMVDQKTKPDLSSLDQGVRKSLARPAAERCFRYLDARQQRQPKLAHVLSTARLTSTLAARKSLRSVAGQSGVAWCDIAKRSRCPELRLLWRTLDRSLRGSREGNLIDAMAVRYELLGRWLEEGNDRRQRHCQVAFTEHVIERWISRNRWAPLDAEEVMRALDLQAMKVLRECGFFAKAKTNPGTFGVCDQNGVWLVHSGVRAAELAMFPGEEGQRFRVPHLTVSTFYGLNNLKGDRKRYWQLAMRSGSREAERVFPGAFPRSPPVDGDLAERIIQREKMHFSARPGSTTIDLRRGRSWGWNGGRKGWSGNLLSRARH